MYYGVSYYPEQKTPEELEHDLKLLIASGINAVRMGEFAWKRMEPEDGRFDFDWLEQVVKRLGENGIKSILCTPTACPPSWLVRKHPEVLYVDNRGITRPFGGRRSYCYNNETYRAYSVRIAGELGRRFGQNPYVAGFQIDNEPAQEASGRCHCPVCREKFRVWLREKYGDIKTYNEKSMSVVWSQEYDGFDEIEPPVTTIEVGAEDLIRPVRENPTLRLEFERFASDSQIAYHTLQAEVLRKYTDRPVTTNTTGLATNSIDYYKGMETLDCFAFDYYPNLRSAAIPAFPYAFARGMQAEKPFWVLEYQAGGGHSLGGTGRQQPYPGMLQAGALQAFANGAELLLHFQYRAFPGGAEQLNYAIVDMDGVPRRRYYEMQETAARLRGLESCLEAEFRSEAAVVFDYDTLWALKIKPINRVEFDYVSYCEAWYENFKRAGVELDVISSGSDFSKYKLLFVPTPFVMSDALRERCLDYVKNGGVLVTTFLCGAKDEYNVGRTEPLPAGLAEACGVTVAELEPSREGQRDQVEFAGRTVENRIWSELLEGEAEALALYRNEWKAGQKAVARHAFGKGWFYYLGTDLGAADAELAARIVEQHGLRRMALKPERAEGVNVVERFAGEKRVYFVFNFAGEPLDVKAEIALQDAETGEKLSGHFQVPGRALRVVREK